MNGQQERAKSILLNALELTSAGERQAYIASECGGDELLRREVEELLLHHAGMGTFLESGIPGLAETADRSGDIQAADRVIGPYKLLEPIGEGGMGVVYLAEQEKPVRRKVALKVIKAGMDTGQVVARFEAERQALAIMDHPNIARVFDAGATDSGRPYFVMELVKGVPITDYCDRNQLMPKERLELFIPVCQAIQHAHQKGIIHRDIKPSNVLVTLQDGVPAPKVIDFGVAKAVDQRMTERTLFTELGAVIGTLEYMSPEQAETGALDIDTRSDIYSLGVLLYELLTGSTPLERAKLRQAAYSVILRRIREEEPPKPSTRLSESKESLPSISAQRKMEPARLTKLVRGELDWIVMMSLGKDRTRRYETANGLARDIQRYLDGDPVEAGPPSASYRLKKFARKHRAALVTAGAFAFLLIAATAVSSGLALWANRERVRAVKAEKLAKEEQGRAQDREAMAINAVRRYGDVVGETPELKNNPGLAKLRATLLKEPQAFFKSLRDQLQADRETTPESLARLAAASFDLGKLTDEIGDKQDALRAFEESLAIRDRLARENPSVARFQSDLATSYNNIGNLQRETGRPAEALASYKKASAIWERLVREHPESPDYASKLGGTFNNMATIDLARRQFDKARAKLTSAIGWQRKALALNPNHPTYRRFLDKELRNLIQAARGLGRADETAAAQRELAELAASDPAKAALDARLAAVLKSQAPKDEAERIQLAYRAYEKALHAWSARLSAEALANTPKLGDDRQTQHRYNAACAAALAASGQGKDAPAPDDAAKTRLRKQAREWLQAELAAWPKILNTGPAQLKANIVPTLQHWKADSDLAGIRDQKELAKLPEEERAAFRQLWTDVDELLAKASRK